MPSFLNEMENEGLIVVGRRVESAWKEHDKIKAVAAAVDAWAEKLSLPLGLVYCGTTINWPSDDPSHSPILIVTFSGAGDDDEPVAGTVGPGAMSLAQAQKIPEAFWTALASEHGVVLEGAPDVFLAAAGWTWTSLEGAGEKVNVSTEDDGCCVIPEALRSDTLTMKVGYC